MSKSKPIGIIITCPLCGGDNNASFRELGDSNFYCQYSNCDEKFTVPTIQQVVDVFNATKQ